MSARHVLRRGCAAALFSMLPAAFAAANVEFIGHFGGEMRTVTVQGDHAYVGQGYSLVIFDISGYGYPQPPGSVFPEAPAWLTSIPVGGVVSDIAVSQGVAYVAAGRAGLQAVDVSNPEAAALLGAYATAGKATGVALEDGFAFVTWQADDDMEETGGLEVVDISDPCAPTLVGAYDTAGGAYRVAVARDRAYVAWSSSGSYEAGLDVLDVHEPASPVWLASGQLLPFPTGLAISNGLAVVACNMGILAILNIADDSAELLAFYPTSAGEPSDVAVAGGIAYVTADTGELEIFSLVQPFYPNSLGYYYGWGRGLALDIQDSVAYVTTGAGVFDVASLIDPLNPTSIAHFATGGKVSNVRVVGDRAYLSHVAEGVSGFMKDAPEAILGGFDIVDIANPARPTLLGNYYTREENVISDAEFTYDIDVEGSMVYAGWGLLDYYLSALRGGLQLVDVSNPSAPVLTGEWEANDLIDSVVVENNVAYVGNLSLVESFDLGILDVSEPTAPTFLSSFQTAGSYLSLHHLAVCHGILYSGWTSYAYYDAGVDIIDTTLPWAPRRLGNYTDTFAPVPWDSIEDLAVDGPLIYVATSDAGCQIIDASVPTNPVLAGYYAPADLSSLRYSGVAAANGKAYLAARGDGVHIVDVRNPAVPELLDTFDTQGRADKVEVANGLIYVADSVNGLLILAQNPRTLTLRIEGNGTTTPAPGEYVGSKDTVFTIAATPDEGWRFHHWKGDAAGDENPLTVTMQDDREVTAVFIPVFSLSTAASPEGSGEVRAEPALGAYDAGSEATLTAIPAPGWRFHHWEGDLAGNLNPAGITFDDHKQVIAAFVRIFGVGVHAVPQEAGSVRIVPVQPVYDEDSEIEVQAIPSHGWWFYQWEDDLRGTENPAVLAVDGPKTVTARFYPLLFIRVEGSGSTFPAPGEYLNYPDVETTIHAVPHPGWVFSHWEAEASKQAVEGVLVVKSSRPMTAVAVFAPSMRSLTVAVEGRGATNPPPGPYTYAEGARVTVAATADPGWAFHHWKGSITGSTNPVTLTLDRDKNLTAVFLQRHALTMSASPPNGGSVDVSPMGEEFFSGEQVTVTAMAAPGWLFDHWEGGLDGRENPRTLAMDSDKDITAVFVRAYVLTVAVQPPDAGHVERTPERDAYAEGSDVTLSAVAAAGYVFDHWEGGAAGAANPLSAALESDMGVTAVFKPGAKPLLSCAGGSTMTPTRVYSGDSLVVLGAVLALILGRRLQKTGS